MRAFVVIDGEPQGKARPRFSRRSGVVYTPAKTMSYEKLVKLSCQTATKVFFEDGKYLQVEIRAFFAIPTSASKKKKEAMLSGQIRPDKKPDLDNIAKVILDSANGLIYADDKQVVNLICDKYYSDRPRVEFEVFEI